MFIEGKKVITFTLRSLSIIFFVLSFLVGCSHSDVSSDPNCLFFFHYSDTPCSLYRLKAVDPDHKYVIPPTEKTDAVVQNNNAVSVDNNTNTVSNVQSMEPNNPYSNMASVFWDISPLSGYMSEKKEKSSYYKK